MSLPISLLHPLIGTGPEGVYCKVCAQAFVDGLIRVTPEDMRKRPYRIRVHDLSEASEWASEHLKSCPVLRQVLMDNFRPRRPSAPVAPPPQRQESLQVENGHAARRAGEQDQPRSHEQEAPDEDVQVEETSLQVPEPAVEELIPQFEDSEPSPEKEGLLARFGGRKVRRDRGTEGS